MRLINTHDLRLEVFTGEDRPPYAILSHTWQADQDEVNLQEYQDEQLRPQLRDRPGFRKIEKVCELAREHYKLKFAWVDTVCIDKTSSAELSEAINSMFNWYQHAAVCVVYLYDLEPQASAILPDMGLGNCRWFTRGFTLQELIAPFKVNLYDREWQLIGNKENHDFARHLSKVSGVRLSVLEGRLELSEVPVAAKMSWASKRETKRPEDRAYCLLGIFDVNMPLLYGEGGVKAFLRLQEEIMKNNSDMSIFAWSSGAKKAEYMGMLATHPSFFSETGNIEPRYDGLDVTPHAMITSRGVTLSSPLKYDSANGLFVLILQYWQNGETRDMSIFLRQVQADKFIRTWPASLILQLTSDEANYTVNIPKTLSPIQDIELRNRVLELELVPLPDFQNCTANPRGCYNPMQHLLIPDYQGLFVASLEFKPEWAGEYDSFVVVCRTFAEYGGIWDLCLFAGDAWIKYKDRVRQLSHDDRFTIYSEAVLRHLYDETKRKKVTAEMQEKEEGRTSLLIQVVG